MVKRNTIEVDDAEDLFDENLVDEELEILSREEETRNSTAASQQKPTSDPAPGPARKLVSRQTQTVAPRQPSIKEPSTGTDFLAQVQSINSVRTLTRQLRTGARKGTVKRSTLQKQALAVTDEDEEDVDNFHSLEAGLSDARRGSEGGNTISANLRSGGNKASLGSKFAVGFRTLNKSLSRTFTLSRLRPKSSRERIKRDNKRAHMNWFQLLIHDLQLAIERQKNERYEFPLFLKRIKSIQGELGSSTAALFLFVRYLLMVNIASSIFWIGLVVVPQALYFDYAKLSEAEGVFTGIQLFLGNGRVADSWLFFKGYEESFKEYKMYVAYLLTHFVSIFIIFFAILKTIGNDVIREGSKSSDQVRSLAMNLFTSWDYSINSHDAIDKQQKSMGSNFKDLLCELTSSKKERTTKELRIMYALRALAWFIWVILVVGAITAIVFVVNHSNSGSSTGFINVYGPTIALTVINVAVPFLMQQLTLIESYDIGRTEQYVTLSRVYVMRMISLITFIVTLINSRDAGDCPQLYWGQEFYKLIIINTMSNCATLFKYPAFHYLLNKKIEVDLPSTLMSLIYFQGCIWFGNLFCPLLSSMGVFSNLIYFAIASTLIKTCCQPPTKRYNSNNSMFFNSFLALTIFIMTAITCFIIVSKPVDCGPWKSPKFITMWDTWGELAEGWNTGLKGPIETILSAAVVVPVVFVLSIVIWLLQINMSKMNLKNDIMAAELDVLRQEKARFLKDKRNGNGHR